MSGATVPHVVLRPSPTSGRRVKSNVTALWDRSSSAQRVALYIRSLLFHGELRSGERVPQDEIAEALGCSRQPVREAVIALEHEGLVTVEPHRGAFVNPLTADTFRDQYELFGSTLAIALTLAVERGGAPFVDALAAAQQRMAGAADIDAFDAANDAFQSLIITTAASARLRAVLRVLSGIVPGNFFEEVPGSRAIQLSGTSVMVQALGAGDPARAAAACRDTMREQAAAVIALLERRGFFALQDPGAGTR
jgi:DNA-binding GntR family transcriptional regulator